MYSIKIQCPAKINLSLKITGRRSDGFHNIESIMQTISLYDYLTINVEKSEIFEIILSGNNREIPYNEKNIVYKAANLFFETLNLNEKFRISIDIEKNIPVAAGLAGGSTDAAGTLFGLNKLFNEKFSKEKLHELCAILGSDLNFCLEGGTQLTTGRGEILKPVDYKEQKISLIKPINLGISAKEAYTKFAQKIILGEIGRENYINDLEWAIIDDYEVLQTIKKYYPKSIMSGSGSTYFILNDEYGALEGFWIKNNLKTTCSGVCVVK